MSSTIDYLLSVPVYRSLVTAKLFPRKFADVRIRLPDHTPDRVRDFTWEACLLFRFSAEIDEFLKIRREFSAALFDCRYEDCDKHLVALEAAHGMSLWLVDAKIILLQFRDGLSAQRAFLESLIEAAGVDRVPAYLAYWFSYRADANVSASTISAEADDLRSAFGKGAAAPDFFTSFIQPTSTHKITEPHLALYGANDVPLFDRYLNFQRMLAIECSRNAERAAADLKDLSPYLGTFDDPALSTIRAILKGERTLKPDEAGAVASVYNSYAIGEFREAQLAALSQLRVDPSAPYYELLARSAAYGGFEEVGVEGDGLRAQVLRAVSDVTLLGPGTDTARARLRKLAASAGFSDMAFQIASVARGTRRFDLVSIFDEADRVWALISPPDNPWHRSLLFGLRQTRPLCDDLRSGKPAFEVENVVMGAGTPDAGQRLDKVGVVDDRKHIYVGRYHARRNNVNEAIEEFQRGASSKNALVALSGRIFLYEALLKQRRYADALEHFANAYYINPHSWVEFDLDSLIEFCLTDSSLHSTLAFANVAYVGMRHIKQSYEAVASDAFERVLDAFGVDRPSRLSNVPEVPSDHLLFFLKNVCSVRIMEDSYLFSSLEEVEQERIMICNWVARNRHEDMTAMEAEIRSLIRASQIASARSRLDQSKIYVDEQGIGTELAPQLRELYDRYMQLLESPELDAQADQINRLIGKIFENTKTVEGAKFNEAINRYKLPSTERNGVLQRAFSELAEWFVISPEFGLDAHLSSNIRHGTFIGHSRSPFSKYRFMISTDSDDTGQDTIEYWQQRTGELGVSDLFEIKRALRRFSAGVNRIIDRVNDDLLRVRDVDFPDGMFVYDALTETQETLAASISRRTTFNEFIDTLFDMAWRQTEAAMEQVRNYLLSDFQDRIGQLLDELEASVERECGRNGMPDFFDAITQARTEFSNTIQRIAGWFRRPNRASDEPLPIDVVVDVAIKEVQSCFPDLDFKPKVVLSQSLNIRGRKIDGCVEILFILLQNAIKHNYDVQDLNAVITVDTDGKTLVLSCTNRIAASVDIVELEGVAEDAQRRYNEQDALAKVRIEGGSGLSKIWRTAQHTMKVDHEIALAVTEDSFTADVMLGLESIQ